MMCTRKMQLHVAMPVCWRMVMWQPLNNWSQTYCCQLRKRTWYAHITYIFCFVLACKYCLFTFYIVYISWGLVGLLFLGKRCTYETRTQLRFKHCICIVMQYSPVKSPSMNSRWRWHNVGHFQLLCSMACCVLSSYVLRSPCVQNMLLAVKCR